MIDWLKKWYRETIIEGLKATFLWIRALSSVSSYLSSFVLRNKYICLAFLIILIVRILISVSICGIC